MQWMQEGIADTIQAMEEYGINREDYDTLGDFMFKVVAPSPTELVT